MTIILQANQLKR